MKKVSVHEAQIGLPALLRAVEQGERVVITQSGKPIADLTPYRESGKDPREAIARIRQMRSGLTLGEASLKELIEKGRR